MLEEARRRARWLFAPGIAGFCGGAGFAPPGKRGEICGKQSKPVVARGKRGAAREVGRVLFKKNEKQGTPGDASGPLPRRRFLLLEVLKRDGGNLIKLNLLAALCYLPAQALFLAAVYNFAPGSALPFVLGGLALLACVPTGPAAAAQYRLTAQMLRGEPGYVWHDFKYNFRRNFGSCWLPGVLRGLMCGCMVLAVLYYVFMLAAGAALTGMMALYGFAVLLFSMLTPHFFTQAAYLHLGASALVRNSLLLALGHPLRSLAAVLAGGGFQLLLGVLAWFFPASLVLVFLLGYSFPCLLRLVFVWPVVNKTFNIEEALAASRPANGDEPAQDAEDS